MKIIETFSSGAVSRVSEVMFDYDQRAPLNIEEAAVEERDGAHVCDISYRSANNMRVAAYLVVPHEEGSHAGIIFLHGGEQDRSDFLDEALSLAKACAVSLLIDEPTVRQMPHFTEPEADRVRFIQTVINVRRGVDLLTSRPEVDAGRIGYMGLSFGAWMGGVLAGVEKRIKAYVLIAGTPSMTGIWRSSQHAVVQDVRRSLTKEQLDRYIEATSPLDAIHHIGRAAPSALFFQFARCDEVISAEAALRYSEAASHPKLTRWYDAGHQDIFIKSEALRDRAAWLSQQIGLRFIG